MDGHRWYAKYIAELAIPSAPANDDEIPWFSLYESPVTGRVIIANATIAPVFLAAVTLVISILVPLLLARIPRAVAIAWCFWTNRHPARDDKTSGNQPGTGSWHLPVVMANSGLFISDAFSSVVGAANHIRSRQFLHGVSYFIFAIFCLVAAVLGPLVALLVSRDTMNGFAGISSGPCMAQYNFTDNATNYVATALEHHMRSYELLAWAPTFNYSWTNNTEYATGKTMMEPTSGVLYEQLDGCLLKDEVLCDSRFPRTHKVSIDLTPSRLGLWYTDSWKLSLEGYCLRLNSTSIGVFRNQKSGSGWLYGLHNARGGEIKSGDVRCFDLSPNKALGQGETERFRGRKNLITDSFFVNSDRDIGYPCYAWRDSLRALDADVLTVITVLPSFEPIAQIPGDDLFLDPVDKGSNFNFAPNQSAHLLCWDTTVVRLADGRSFKTSASWANRSALITEHGLPQGLNPLLHFVNTEFVAKPARFLRGSSSLLQSVADVPAWEYGAYYAPPVPFAAEIHRWAHIGAMDIASKATRVATGFYSRGNVTAVVASQKQVPAELQDLCNAVRLTREGAVSMPIRTLIALLILLIVSMAWWAIERAVAILAAWGLAGPGGTIRAFLVLSASTPVALAVSAEVALLKASGWGSKPEEKIFGSASGQPVVRLVPEGMHAGPGLEAVEDGRWALSWGFAGLGGGAGRRRVKIE